MSTHLSFMKLSDLPAPEQSGTLPGFSTVRRYWDRDNLVYCAKILPGEYYVTDKNELIMTTLGSCVAACVRDRVTGVGGMNHFMLPTHLSSSEKSVHPNLSIANRYGSFAMENLINDILKHGGQRINLEIKYFGGGKVLAQMTDIGQKNIEFIEDFIKIEGLSLVAKDVGSIYPRKIIFDPKTGSVKVKKLRSIMSGSLLEKETEYMQNIHPSAITGKIEIFK